MPVSVPSNGILSAGGSLLSQSMFTINQNFKNPYTEAWNIAVQQSLPLKLILDVAYVGIHGVDIPGQYNLNTTTDPALLGSGHRQPTSVYRLRQNRRRYDVLARLLVQLQPRCK